MPDSPQPTSPPPSVACSGALPLRHPAVFSGTDEQDVNDWLSTYERVSLHNRWDDTAKLNAVIFYLAGVAHLWFKNHEADFQSWSAFKTSFAEVFGRPAVHKLRAEQRLRERAQQPGETFTCYIEEVLDLCKRVDASMPENDKLKHILKGIADDIFQMLIAKSPRTVAELINLCQSYDELRRQRDLTRRPSVADETLSSMTVFSDRSPLLTQIQAFVREEVARQLSLLPFAELPQQQPLPQQPPTQLAPTLRRVIEEQVAEALPMQHQQSPVAAPLTYASVAAQPPRQPLVALHPRPLPPVHHPVHRPPPAFANPWRTQDNRPICYACGIPGHVARLCRRRMLHSDGFAQSPPYADVQPFHDTSFSRQSNRPPAERPVLTRRSPSPRRRSLSPMRRRPSPTQEEN